MHAPVESVAGPHRIEMVSPVANTLEVTLASSSITRSTTVNVGIVATLGLTPFAARAFTLTPVISAETAGMVVALNCSDQVSG
jgi:hypothetical protein